jgi:Flp pilus assembly protein TadG
MITRIRSERGQVTVLTAVFMVALVGLCGFVLDVGSWFRQQRQQQTTVDSAALAGAQSLPNDPANATALATDFATRNGGIAGATITIGSKYRPNDMITVQKDANGDGLFSKLFGVSTVTIRTKATAIVESPSSVWGVAPIVVDIHHPMLSGSGCPCFGVPTTIPLGPKGAPGAFGFVDLSNSNGTVGDSTLSDWIKNGYQHWLPLGNYNSDPGAKFNPGPLQATLNGKIGTDLLFPIYDALTNQGSNAPYHIIAWAAFHLTATSASGNNGAISGWFDRIVWEGLVPPTGPDPNQPDLGVGSVALID